jgi:hypothetical protein
VILWEMMVSRPLIQQRPYRFIRMRMHVATVAMLHARPADGRISANELFHSR